MAELKTKPTTSSVEDFLNGVDNEVKRRDSFVILNMMQEATGCEPVMWGSSIVGFGTYHYKYASGQEGDWPLIGFSPRKQAFSLYIMTGFDRYAHLMESLGKYKTGKGCLYINRLEDIQLPTLEKLVQLSVAHMVETNPSSA